MTTQATESLRDQLADLASKMSAQIPRSVQQTMREADEQLADSPLLKSSLKVGDEAPSFQLPNATGQIVSSADLLKNGSLVLSFYRGGWCPYCNLRHQSERHGRVCLCQHRLQASCGTIRHHRRFEAESRELIYDASAQDNT